MHRAVARPVSWVFLGLAFAMAACASTAWAFEFFGHARRAIDEGAHFAMILSAACTAGAAGACWYWGRNVESAPFGRREATFAVIWIWVGAGILGALPYLFGARMAPADALFEALSGLTTTGATVVEDIEGTLSNPLLLWRSLTQWLGGMGIVVLFVAVFPNLGVGGKHMFRSEVPGVSAEGLQPRIAETAFVLYRIYVALTVCVLVALWALGMNLFESLNHALTTMASGGFSTRNDSIAAFDSAPIEMVIVFFMMLSGVNFGIYFAILRTGRLSLALRSTELRVYLTVIAVFTVLVSISLLPAYDMNWLQSLRYAVFMVVAFITSTGYGTSDTAALPAPALLLVIGLMFMGGSAGSTSGGFKVSRIVILFETAKLQLRRSIRPAVVQVVRLDKRVLDDSVQLEVATMLFLYAACLVLGMLFVGYTDNVPLPTAFGAMVSALSNMGPAAFYEGADNFARYSPAAKVMFAVAMVIGRLEFFTVLALLVPDLWRR